MDKQYIWFVGADKEDCFTGFGAGTSIEKANFPYPPNWNILDAQLKIRDELRTHMIALAIQHKDIEMLERLHAREIPTLYQMSFYSPAPKSCEQYYNAKLMEALTHANNEILEYFCGEFEIPDRVGFPNRFLFPFMGKLIERLLQNKNDFTEYMLKSAIQHNQYVFDQLAALLSDTVQSCGKLYYDVTNSAAKSEMEKRILSDLCFYDDGSLVSYFALFPETKEGLRSNIIRVNAESADAMINRRIWELNDLYDAIHHITPNFEGGAE